MTCDTLIPPGRQGSTGSYWEFDERGLLHQIHIYPNFAYIPDNSWTHAPILNPSPKPVIKENCTDLLKISNIERADLKITVHIAGCSPNNSLFLGCVKIPKNKMAWRKRGKFVKPVSSPKCLLLHQIMKPLYVISIAHLQHNCLTKPGSQMALWDVSPHNKSSLVAQLFGQGFGITEMPFKANTSSH